MQMLRAANHVRREYAISAAFSSVFLFALLCVDRPAAQSPRPLFTSTAELVSLAVTVTNARGEFIGEPGPGHFQVLEDGIPQPIAFFGAGEVGVDLLLLVDSSRSITGRMAMAQDAAAKFLRSRKPSARASIMSFGSRVELVADFTTDRARLEREARRLRPAGMTALYDAVYIALRTFERLPAADEVRRRALVILSDGKDTSSLMSYETTLDLARRLGVATYVISLHSFGSPSESRFSDDARQLSTPAGDTGGLSFFTPDIAEIGNVYASIADELAHQYAVAFVPATRPADVPHRRLAVQVSFPGARVRTRSGYIPG